MGHCARKKKFMQNTNNPLHQRSMHTCTCTRTHARAHTHTHTFNGPFPELPRFNRSNSGSGISWAICKSAPHSRLQTDNYATPAPHHSVFYRLDPFLPPNQQHQSTEGNSLHQRSTHTRLTALFRDYPGELVPER